MPIDESQPPSKAASVSSNIRNGIADRAMDFQDLISRFAVALGIGLLIGLERGWRTREERAGSRTAGIRTFAISALLGGVIGGLSHV